jgi:hypothetical protein
MVSRPSGPLAGNVNPANATGMAIWHGPLTTPASSVCANPGRHPVRDPKGKCRASGTHQSKPEVFGACSAPNRDVCLMHKQVTEVRLHFCTLRVLGLALITVTRGPYDHNTRVFVGCHTSNKGVGLGYDTAT